MNNSTLGKDDFWKIIENAHTSKDQTEDEYLDTLQAALVKLGPENIVRFQEIMDEYESLAYVPGLWEAAGVIKGGCSDDGFIDFRAWLMAQGKETYLKALADPDSLAALDLPFDFEYTIPDLCSMEYFSYVPAMAYQELGRNDIYDDTRALPEEVLGDIRSEIRYAPGIGTPKRTAVEVEAALPRLCEKSPGSHEPGWTKHIYSKKIRWGCEWMFGAASPNANLDGDMGCSDDEEYLHNKARIFSDMPACVELLRALENHLGIDKSLLGEWMQAVYEINQDFTAAPAEMARQLVSAFREVGRDYGKEIARDLYNSANVILPAEIVSAGRYLSLGGKLGDLRSLAATGWFMDGFQNIPHDRLLQAVNYMNNGGLADGIHKVCPSEIPPESDTSPQIKI